LGFGRQEEKVSIKMQRKIRAGPFFMVQIISGFSNSEKVSKKRVRYNGWLSSNRVLGTGYSWWNTSNSGIDYI